MWPALRPGRYTNPTVLSRTAEINWRQSLSAETQQLFPELYHKWFWLIELVTLLNLFTCVFLRKLSFTYHVRLETGFQIHIHTPHNIDNQTCEEVNFGQNYHFFVFMYAILPHHQPKIESHICCTVFYGLSKTYWAVRIRFVKVEKLLIFVEIVTCYSYTCWWQFSERNFRGKIRRKSNHCPSWHICCTVFHGLSKTYWAIPIALLKLEKNPKTSKPKLS